MSSVWSYASIAVVAVFPWVGRPVGRSLRSLWPQIARGIVLAFLLVLIMSIFTDVSWRNAAIGLVGGIAFLLYMVCVENFRLRKRTAKRTP